MPIRNILKKLNSRDTRIFPKFKTIHKVLITVSTIAFVLFLSKSILAQSDIQKVQDAIKGKNNQESWLNNALTSNIVSTAQLLVGEIPATFGQTDPATGDPIIWIPGGAIGGTNKIIGYLFQPQASGIEYLAQLKNNFLGKPVYAQGVATNSLQSLVPIWKTFRNVVYVLFSLVFVIVGIMIMLRVKISPQATITIQNSIPKIITTLILVTFSYAIAGLLIDLSYFVQTATIALLFQAKPFTDPLLKMSFFDSSLQGLSTIGFWETFRLLNHVLPLAWTMLAGLIVGGIVAFFTLGAGIILILVVPVIVLILLVTFFFGLIKCYFTILLKIILAPLEIFMGAFPNSKMGFSSWIMDLIANIAVFPISALFLIIACLISESVKTGGLWVPSALNGVPNMAGIAIGFGTLMLLSKLPTMIPEFIFQIKPSPWGKAIGEATGNIPLLSGGVKNIKHAAGEKFGENMIGNKYGKGVVESAKLKWNTRKGGQGGDAKKSKPETSKPTTFGDDGGDLGE